MLFENPSHDQSIPSCSTSSHPLQNYTQALSSPIKGVAPIKVINESINGLGHVAHSKDADIPIHYPFVSPKSILGPYSSKLKPSNLPSILGPYVPLSPTSTLSSLHLPQDQQRYTYLNSSHSPFHLN